MSALWRAAVNGTGALPWFVVRGQGSSSEYLETSDGRIKRYSRNGAAKAAAAANAENVNDR